MPNFRLDGNIAGTTEINSDLTGFRFYAPGFGFAQHWFIHDTCIQTCTGVSRCESYFHDSGQVKNMMNAVDVLVPD